MANQKTEAIQNYKAMHRFARISPYKVREIADLVRGKRAEDALITLQFMPQKATGIIEKLLKSAVANAEQREVPPEIEKLYIDTITVDEGPTMYRIRFRAQGRVYRIRKRTSHINIVLVEKVDKHSVTASVKAEK